MASAAKRRPAIRILINVALTGVLLVWAASLLVPSFRDAAPWTKFVVPLFFALMGLRSLLTQEDSQYPPMKARTAAIIQFAGAAIILILILTHS